MGSKTSKENVAIAQCPRTDLSKRFLPKPMTTTGAQGERGPPKESKSR